MAGYSGTPLWKKLGIKPGSRWAVVRAPVGFTIEDRPDSKPNLTKVTGKLDGLLAFCKTEKELSTAMAAAMGHIYADGSVWIAWPKKSSTISTKLEFSVVQSAGLDLGLVDNKVCAIDDDWSGLRFVVRTASRAEWPVKR